MAAEQELAVLRGALADFITRPGLPKPVVDALTPLVAGNSAGFGVDAAGRLALTPAALGELLSLKNGAVSLARMRKKQLGPPWGLVMHGNQQRVMYPVEGVRRWLAELAFGGSYYPDPKVLAAFGLTPRDDASAQEAA